MENGADAVYLGGKLFSARRQADNFDTGLMKEALDYAHTKGASIYLAMNTLVSDSEMKQALLFAAEAREAGIDGIIVQDLGLAGALRIVMPDVPLHGSTQMTVYDVEGAYALEALGFKRVVLARELTLKEVSHIARNTQLEVEIFVHGALCISYSGQCLMSSMIGGRSGNRGMCAQPCRLPYKLYRCEHAEHREHYIPEGLYSGQTAQNRDLNQKSQYLLSPKDMCSLEHLGEIVASGVHSLKIEGRMKSAEYVATVVRIYRKYLDLAEMQSGSGSGDKLQVDRGNGDKLQVAAEDMHDLLQIFNRGGFSTGYLKGRTGSGIMSIEKPNNSGIYLGSVIAYDEKMQSVDVRLENKLSVGDGLEIWIGVSNGPGGIVTTVKKGNISLKTAGRGEQVTIGSFRGNITSGDGIYKTMDAELCKAARESFTGNNIKRIEIWGHAALKSGTPLMVAVKDGGGHDASAVGTILPEAAINRPLTGERLREQLGKTGATPFTFIDLQIELESGLSLPVSEINEVRRLVLDKLLNLRADRYANLRSSNGIGGRIRQVLQGTNVTGAAATATTATIAATATTATIAATATTATTSSAGCPASAAGFIAPALSLYFYKWNQNIDYSKLGADRIYLPLAAFDRQGFKSAAAALREAGSEVFGWLPTVTGVNCDILIDKFLNVSEREKAETVNAESVQERYFSRHGINGILVGNLGTVHKLKEINNLRLAGDISMNLFNTLSLREAARMGLESVALSIEMTMQQIARLAKISTQIGGFEYMSGSAPGNAPIIETAVYGRLPLMTSKYCPVGCIGGGFENSRDCKGVCSKGSYMLQDRLGAEFPVLSDRLDCQCTLLNSKVLFVPDSLQGLKSSGVGLFRLYIWEEPVDVIKELILMYRAAASGDSRGAATHSGLAARTRVGGFTKGHYFRGV